VKPPRGNPWLAAVPGARSLHRQLFIWLLLPQVVLWIAAAFFTYNLAARYANEAIDASLLQASRALARQVKPMESGLFIDLATKVVVASAKGVEIRSKK